MRNIFYKKKKFKNRCIFTKLWIILLFLLLISNTLQNSYIKTSSLFAYKKLSSINNFSDNYNSISIDSKLKIFDAYKLSKEYNEGAFFPYMILDDNGNIHAVWNSNINNRRDIIYRNYSITNDKWSNTTIISEGIEHNYSEYPIIKMDSQNRIHVIWRESSTHNFLKYRFYNGICWSEVKTIAQLNKTTFAHDLVVDKNNNVHFVWNNINQTKNYDLYYRSYSINNNNWTAVLQITNSSRASLSPTIAIDTIDNIHLVWVDGTINSSSSEIQYRKIENDDWGHNSSIVVSSSDDILSHRPSISVDKKNILSIVWEDSTSTNYEIYYRNIDSGNLSAIVKISSSDGGFYPSIYIDKDNNQHITWYESEKILFKYFIQGNGWSDNFVITDQNLILIFPQIIVNSNQFFIIWNDFTHELAWEIYFINGLINRNLDFLYIVIPVGLTLICGAIFTVFFIRRRERKLNKV